jgi:hypothetical protein
MADMGFDYSADTYTPDLSGLTPYIPEIHYDSGSSGGPAGDTQAPSSTFNTQDIFNLLGQGLHTYEQAQQHAANGGYSSPQYPYTPPPAASSSMAPPPPAIAPAPAASTMPQWVQDLTNFQTPVPYIAAGVAIFLVGMIQQGRR